MKWGLWADETGSRDKGLVWDAEAPAAVASFPELADDRIIWGGNYFALPPVRFAPSRDREVYSITDKGRAKLGVVTVLTPLRRVGPRGRVLPLRPRLLRPRSPPPPPPLRRTHVRL